MNIRSRWFLLFAGLMSVTMVMAAACSSGTSSGDKTKTAAAGGPPSLGLHLLMGKSTPEIVRNMIDDISKGRIAPGELIARKAR